MISSNNISVIVQGAIGKEIDDCIRSIREHLPDSEIILSTWEGSQIPPGLAVDVCLFNRDPGARPVDCSGKLLNNTNRQLVSTLAGLRAAQRPYALKLRTDFRITSTGFIKAFATLDKRPQAFAHYRQKIVIPHYATRHPIAAHSYPFHPSDISLFGQTEDLIKHFDVPLLGEEDWDWTLRHPEEVPRHPGRPIFLPRYAPEQHFFVCSLRASGHEVPLRHHADHSADIPLLSRKYLISNFIVLDMRDFGIATRKPSLAYAIEKDINNCYSHTLYRSEYKLWCDPDLPLTFTEQLEARLTRNKKLHEKLVKHSIAMKQHAGLLFSKSDESRFTHGHKMVADALSSFYYFLRAIV